MHREFNRMFAVHNLKLISVYDNPFLKANIAQVSHLTRRQCGSEGVHSGREYPNIFFFYSVSAYTDTIGNPSVCNFKAGLNQWVESNRLIRAVNAR